MHLTTGYEERKPRIEIVPLIDVVFLLLVFFIYAMLSMTVYRGLRVKLPGGAGITEEMKTVRITIAEDNTLWVEEQALSLPEVVALVVNTVRDEERPVLVSGDRRADLGTAVELLSALRRARVESVSFQVRHEE